MRFNIYTRVRGCFNAITGCKSAVVVRRNITVDLIDNDF